MPNLNDIFQPGQNVPMASLKTYLQDSEAGINAARLSAEGRVAPNAVFDGILDDVTIISAEDGTATVKEDLDQLFQTLYTPGTTVKHVATWGSDSNDGDDWANAYLTIGKTKTVACDTVKIAPGEYAPADWRYDDTGGGDPRRFVAPWGNVIIRTSGSAVSGLTFSQNGTYGHVYEATLADPATVHRLLRTDVLDALGRPMPMPRFDTLANLAVPGYGWCHDTAADKLYVSVGGVNIESSFKANLKAIYDNGGASRILLYASTSYWEGVEFRGYVYPLFQPGEAQPVAFFKNCTFAYSANHGLLADGAKVYTQDCIAYRPAGDGANYNLGTGDTPCTFLENNLQTFCPGDEDSYPGQTYNPLGTGYNKQGVSNHNAVGIQIGGHHDGAAGQLLAHTAVGGFRSKTWILGVKFGRSRATTASSSGWGLHIEGGDAWVENITVPSGNAGGIVGASAAVINHFNMKGERTGTTFTAYVPEAS